MTVFRTLAEIREAGPLTWAEETLLDCVVRGETAVIGEERPSDDETDESIQKKTIRAGIIRYLMLGGCDALRPHEKGIFLSGAVIVDKIDLARCKCIGDLVLGFCLITQVPRLYGAQLNTLSLLGSKCPGINGDRLKTTGDVNLFKGFYSTGDVRLLGAKIGGDLNCSGGTFIANSLKALACDHLDAAGSVYLKSTTSRMGEISLVAAKIKGDLDCSGGSYYNDGKIALNCDGIATGRSVFFKDEIKALGEVCFIGTKIGGSIYFNNSSFTNPSGVAINCQSASVAREMFFRKPLEINGAIDLTATRASTLVDDIASWPGKNGQLRLNGFTYDRIADGPVDAETRLKWLALSDGTSVGADFWPQPYEQLASVLRKMGHTDDARTILVAKERLQHKDWLRRTSHKINELRDRLAKAPDQVTAQQAQRALWKLRFTKGWAPKWNWLLDVSVGYGHRPLRSLRAVAILICAGFCLFFLTWQAGAFAPNNGLILLSPEWVALANTPNPADAWEAGPGRDYETFNALAYAFDVVVPLIDLGQEAAWAPSTSRGWSGTTAWWARWVLKTFGWIVTALGAAAITGVIRRD